MDIFKKYIEKYGIVRHQYEGFNDFVLYGIQKVIDDEPDIYFNGKLFSFSNVKFTKPSIAVKGKQAEPLLPDIAREKSITYAFNVFVDVFEDGNNIGTIHLCTLPAMVGSIVCNLNGMSSEDKMEAGETMDDLGGFFIMNGKERIITGQMKKVYNRILSTLTIDDLVVVEMRSFCEESAKSQLVQLKYNNKKTEIDVTLDSTNYKLQNILHALGHFEQVSKLLGAENDFTLDEVMFLIESGPVDVTRVPDLSQLFPHLGLADNLTKTLVLVKMLKKLVLSSSKVLQCDMIGNIGNKRVDMVGVLCQDLFKMLWKQFIKSIVKEVNKRKVGNILPILNFKKKNISLNFYYCFSTGTWGIKKNAYKKLGVSEFAQMKVSALTNMALLRKISIPISKKDKNVNIRMTHPSSQFYLCPFETPEGASVGTRMALSASAYTSMATHPVIIRKLLRNDKIYKDFLDTEDIMLTEKETLVTINGLPIGTVESYEKIYTDIDKLRVQNIIPRDTSLYYDKFLDIFEIWCDAGRFIRPLIKYSPSNDKKTLEEMRISDLEDLGILVYRDPIELESSYVNPKWDSSIKSDYVELDPSLVLGVVSGQIVFSNHTQSPRICYMSNMIKQAMGVLPSLKKRTDVTCYSLDYVQKPLNTTRMAEILGTNNQPNGLNAIVAVACYGGYNQEDSIIVNKSSVDRGLFSASVRRTIFTEIKMLSSFEETVCIPTPECRQHSDYSKLDENGIVRRGTFVRKGDVVIGKMLCTKTSTNVKYEDTSVTVRLNEEGWVDDVMIQENNVKVCILQVKIPEIGDKLCSGMAQKGTIGMLLRQEDMPFSSDGMVPDLIINPHCLPSRMTINQSLSSVCAAARCITGDSKYSEGSPFLGTKIVEEACEELVKNGFSEKYTTVMYNGYTGKKLYAKIFMGPVYYHRLPHLVSNKIFSSVHTNVKNKLTRQPLNGRSNDGGLRIGEMEKDCLLGHGIVKFSNERLMDLSDKYILSTCNNCKGYHHVAKYKKSNGNSGLLCSKCKTLNISSIAIPYGAKLLAQELESMGLNVILDA